MTDTQIILAGFQAVGTIGSLFWILKTIKSEVRDIAKKTEERHSELSERLNNLEKELPYKFVTQEQFANLSAGLDRRLKNIENANFEMLKKLEYLRGQEDTKNEILKTIRELKNEKVQ